MLYVQYYAVFDYLFVREHNNSRKYNDLKPTSSIFFSAAFEFRRLFNIALQSPYLIVPSVVQTHFKLSRWPYVNSDRFAYNRVEWPLRRFYGRQFDW